MAASEPFAEHVDDGHGSGSMSEPADDRLARLRSELEAVDRVPVEERVELFERANALIAGELAELDEV